MARGWESKSVEEQQSSAQAEGKKPSQQHTPEQIQRLNSKVSVELARAKVAAELKHSQNPRYQEMLKAELAVLDQRLAEYE